MGCMPATTPVKRHHNSMVLNTKTRRVSPEAKTENFHPFQHGSDNLRTTTNSREVGNDEVPSLHCLETPIRKKCGLIYQ